MTLKVISYNILLGGEDRLAIIAEVIRSQRADAVALLEANRHDHAAILARELRMQLTFGEANSDFHIAWLTQNPVHGWANHRQPALAKTLLEIEITWEDAPLCLFATHLASRRDATTPADEVLTILDALRQCDRPHLLVGDFNALRPGDPVGTPPSGEEKREEARDGAPRRAIGRMVDGGYLDCYRGLHPRTSGYTYPLPALWLRLDYVFASPEMARRLVACDVVTGDAASRASDHLPVWAEFR